MRGIQAYEEAHPEVVLATSPTGKVAGGAVVGDMSHTVRPLRAGHPTRPGPRR
ncbi:hypothetical protein [Streptosporangium amethystogenes]|uniref:hypothetical protein n=1 Tax=Streptosporangium amethystogenes TaxID=2002 RepID=UPI000B2959B8|nr:hypothetical protein [Streptosporangium amethystogenes]